MDRKDKPQAEERIGRILSEAIGEEISREPEVSITPQELKRLAAESGKKARRKKRIFRGAAAVCCIALGIFLPLNMAPTTAEKNAKTHTESQGDTVVIQQGDTEGSVGSKQIVETDWDKVQSLAKEVEDLYIPGYVPEGYEFERAVLEITGKDYKVNYSYLNSSGGELKISQQRVNNTGIVTSYLEGNECNIETERGTIEILKKEEGKILGILQEDKNSNMTLTVTGIITQKQCMRIINEFKSSGKNKN